MSRIGPDILYGQYLFVEKINECVKEKCQFTGSHPNKQTNKKSSIHDCQFELNLRQNNNGALISGENLDLIDYFFSQSVVLPSHILVVIFLVTAFLSLQSIQQKQQLFSLMFSSSVYIIFD